MKHALIAATFVVAGLTAGCGGDDGADKGTETAPKAASTEEFCTAYTSLFESFSAGETPSDEEAVTALKTWATDLEETGTPEEIPADARRGFDLIITTVDGLEDDATQADIQKLTEDMSTEEQADSTAFGSYAQTTCPTPVPGAPETEEK